MAADLPRQGISQPAQRLFATGLRCQQIPKSKYLASVFEVFLSSDRSPRVDEHEEKLQVHLPYNMPSAQMAQFVYLGQFGDTFGPGKHTLVTDNIPVLSTLKGEQSSGVVTPNILKKAVVWVEV